MPHRACRAERPLQIHRLPSQQLIEAMIRQYRDPKSFRAPGASQRFRALLDSWRESCEPQRLTLEAFAEVARPGSDGCYRRVEIDPAVMLAVEASRREVDGYLDEQKLVYGVTTGYGSQRRYIFEDTSDAGRLSANILRSHATGVGSALPPELVRGMLLLRLWTFAQGYSGVSPVILTKLAEMLNRGVVPYVPEKGSVGCSGDLCSLAHLFLVLIGEGRARLLHPGTSASSEEWLAGSEAMRVAGIEPLSAGELQAKDGLALSNGATLSTAMLALAVLDAERLYKTANISGAVTHQALNGHTRVFEPHVGAVRPHPGQTWTAWELYHLLHDSTLKNRCSLIGEAQDDYSVRSLAAVHGAVWDTIAHARRVAEIEINSATDNPLFFKGMPEFQFRYLQDLPRHELVARSLEDTFHCSAANFHGEPVALALDFLKIAAAELASLAERRIQLLLDSHHNRGLAGNLALGKPGLQSGFMLFQYTAASLVSENKVLCHPSSVDSIPTSANAEDHVSMAANAGRHLRQVLDNVTDVIAIEIICALQAVDLRTYHLKPWVREAMQLDLEAARRVRRRLGLDSDTPLETEDAVHVRTFIEEKFQDNAILFFPNLGEPQASADQLLDAAELKLSSRTQRLHAWVRASEEEGGLGVPLIGGDGLPQPALGSSFEDFPPSELIKKVAAALRRGRVTEVVWGEAP